MHKLILFLLLSPSLVVAMPEKYHQGKWCEERNGTTELVLFDKTRVDCITEEYAVEFDFASKWAESLGQSLYYGMITNKTPGIVIILESEKDKLKYERLKNIINHYKLPIVLFDPIKDY